MEWIQLLRQLAPDVMDEAARRALVLERIADMAPVGRRQLAARLMLPEREIRSSAAALREQGLIALDASGNGKGRGNPPRGTGAQPQRAGPDGSGNAPVRRVRH